MNKKKQNFFPRNRVTVSGIALTLPSSEFTVSGSPVTGGNGTLSAIWKPQIRNKFFSGPVSGAATTPTFRNLDNLDLPIVDATHGGTGFAAFTVGDILVANSSTTLTVISAPATGYVFISAGIGVQPGWSQAPTINVSLTCPIVRGSSSSGGTLTFNSTSNATKGKIFFGTWAAFDEVNSRFGFGTLTPTTKVEIVGAPVVNSGILLVSASGVSGSTANYGARIDNTCTSNGGNPFFGTSNGNWGIFGYASGAGTGVNIGNGGIATGSTASFNVGLFGDATAQTTNLKYMGVGGFARVPTGTGIGVAGFFGLMNTMPTLTSAALVADNGSTAFPIFLARDNGTVVVWINDGGNAFFGGSTTPTARIHCAAQTTAASTAPLKFITGTVNTTAEAGAFEYTTPQLFFTNGGAQRQEIPLIQQSRVSTQFDKTSSVALANITGLTATLVAGKFYRFEADLFTTSNIAGGVQVAIGGTATATLIRYEVLITDAGLNTQGRGAALATAVGVTAVTAAFIRITGFITCNAAGTLTVQFAQNASNGTASSVLTGSQFFTREMA